MWLVTTGYRPDLQVPGHLQLLSMFFRLETPILARIKGKGAHKTLVLMNAGKSEPYFSANFCLFG